MKIKKYQIFSLGVLIITVFTILPFFLIMKTGHIYPFKRAAEYHFFDFAQFFIFLMIAGLAIGIKLVTGIFLDPKSKKVNNFWYYGTLILAVAIALILTSIFYNLYGRS